MTPDRSDRATDYVPIPGSYRPEVPEVEEAPEPRYAGFWIRLAGLLVGELVQIAVCAPALLAGPWLSRMLIAAGITVAFGTLQWFLLGLRGFTVEKWIVRLRVVNAVTGEPLGLWRALCRQLVLWLIVAPTAGMGAIALAVAIHRDPRRRGWHDRAVGAVEVRGTVVPRAPREIVEPPPPPVAVAAPAPSWVGVPSPQRADGPRTESHSVPVTSYVLGMTDGQRVLLDGVLVVGRDPDVAGTFPGARRVAVVDRTMSVSKTHAAFGVDGMGPWVRDLASTNGTYVLRGGVVVSEATERFALQERDIVRLGDLEFAISRTP